MSRLASRARRAFTLVEILVAVAILGIIGAGLVRLILSQTRFTEKQMASRNARTVSRNAMNIMLTDLRMVQDSGGLVEATDSTITTLVPLAFGLMCSGNTVSLLPVDSAMTALAYYGGWAVRDSGTQRYSYRDANPAKPYTALVSPALSTNCSNATTGISQVTFNGRTGRVIDMPDSPGGPSNAGWPVFVYQRIQYTFENSNTFPGRKGLFRKVQSGGSVTSGSGVTWKTDEIIAPFDATAKFRFYVLNEDTAQSAVPADLKTVRGLQLYLAGSSAGVPRSGTGVAQQALVTGVFFKNRRDP